MKIPQSSEQALAFKENEDLYKRMNKSVERKIASKELEIKNLDELYDKKIAAAHGAGETEYLQSLDRNQQRMLGETNTFEEKMQGYKDQMKKAQDMVAKEEANIKGTEKLKLESLKSQLQENFQDQFSSTQENQREIQDASTDAVKTLLAKTKSEKLTMENNAQYEINALSSGFNQKAADSERDFRSKLDSDVRLHNAEIRRQQDELKKLMTTDMEKNKRLGAEQNRVSNDQLAYQDKHQKDMLKQRDEDFKVRYDRIVKEHETILKNISTHLESDVKKMVMQTSTDKKKIESRLDDPFYRVDKLNPKMVEELKEVIVSVPVAEYEKENIHLSTQGRSIKMTLSRKYSDSVNDENGGVNRSTRSELFSKELTSKDLLSPKEISQHYEDGILTFKIKKA